MHKRLQAFVISLFALVALVVAPTAAAAQPVGINDVRTLHFVRLNCDDEMETFSDEIVLHINGRWSGGRGNMDGGDWWDLPLSGQFESPITLRFDENDGQFIGEHTITTDDAGRGEIVITWRGFHGTGYQYRLTYFVS